MPGVPVIYDGNNPAAAGVIRARAQELGSPYFEVKREDTKIIRNTRAGIDFLMRMSIMEIQFLRFHLLQSIR